MDVQSGLCYDKKFRVLNSNITSNKNVYISPMGMSWTMLEQRSRVSHKMDSRSRRMSKNDINCVSNIGNVSSPGLTSDGCGLEFSTKTGKVYYINSS